MVGDNAKSAGSITGLVQLFSTRCRTHYPREDRKISTMLRHHSRHATAARKDGRPPKSDIARHEQYNDVRPHDALQVPELEMGPNTARRRPQKRRKCLSIIEQRKERKLMQQAASERRKMLRRERAKSRRDKSASFKGKSRIASSSSTSTLARPAPLLPESPTSSSVHPPSIYSPCPQENLSSGQKTKSPAGIQKQAREKPESTSQPLKHRKASSKTSRSPAGASPSATPVSLNSVAPSRLPMLSPSLRLSHDRQENSSSGQKTKSTAEHEVKKQALDKQQPPPSQTLEHSKAPAGISSTSYTPASLNSAAPSGLPMLSPSLHMSRDLQEPSSQTMERSKAPAGVTSNTQLTSCTPASLYSMAPSGLPMLSPSLRMSRDEKVFHWFWGAVMCTLTD